MKTSSECSCRDLESESRRDKRREVSWTLTKKPRRDQEQGGGAGLHTESWTSFASVVSQRRSYGHCLCDSVLHSSWGSNCVVLWSLRNAGRTQPQHFVVLTAVFGRLDLPGSRLFRGFTLLSPLFPLVPVPNRPTRLRGC